MEPSVKLKAALSLAPCYVNRPLYTVCTHYTPDNIFNLVTLDGVQDELTGNHQSG